MRPRAREKLQLARSLPILYDQVVVDPEFNAAYPSLVVADQARGDAKEVRFSVLWLDECRELDREALHLPMILIPVPKIRLLHDR